MTKHGHNGMLYREGEFCIVMNTQGEQVVLRLCDIFSVNVNGVYHSFICIHPMKNK